MIRYAALTLGIVCHLSFLAAVSAMVLWLFGGMDLGPAHSSPYLSLILRPHSSSPFPGPAVTPARGTREEVFSEVASG